MEGDNIMKRLTSYLVPSFVSNALTPGRRNGSNSSSQLNDNHVTSNAHGQNLTSAEGLAQQQQQQSAVASLTAAPNLGKPQRQSSPTEADSQQMPKRRRGLGGTPAADDVVTACPSAGNPAGQLWSSSASFSNFNASVGGGKRRCVLDDEFSGLSSAAKRSRTMLASPTQQYHHPHYSTSLSLFYAGRTGYGGGYNAQVPGRSVRVTPMQLEPHCEGFSNQQQQQQQLVTPTAKKILDSLDRLSTPLVDARRMPQSSASAQFSPAAGADATGSAAPTAAAFVAPYRVAYRRRFHAAGASVGTPPTRGQQQQPASASIAADSFRSRDLSVPPTAASNQVRRPKIIEDETPLSAMEFQFSAPIYRGGQSNKISANSWQCLDCFVTNAPGAIACISCSVANKPTSVAKPSSASTAAVAASSASTAAVAASSASTAAVAASSASTAAVTASSASTASTSDWRCNTCMCTSPASSQVCIVCQEKRPAPIGIPSSATTTSSTNSIGINNSVTVAKSANVANSSEVSSASGEWRCNTCMCTSPASSQVCVVCQEKRPGASASLAPSEGMTKRPSFIDRGPATAPIFSMFSQQQQQNQVTNVSKWQCDTCLVENVASVSRCVACESPKPGAVISKPTASEAVVPKVSFGAPTNAAIGSDSGPKISFGAPSTGEVAISGQGFSFGGQSSAAGNSSESASKISFGIAPTVSDAGPKISFGAASTSTASDPATKIIFGASSGVTSGASLPSFTFGTPSSVASSNAGTMNSFGVPSVGGDASAKTSFGTLATGSNAGTKTGFGFASSVSSDAGTKVSFGIPLTGSDSGTKTAFGLIPSTGSDSVTKNTFGVIPSTGSDSGTKTTFGVIPSTGSNTGTKTAFGIIPSTGSDTGTNTAFGIPSAGISAGTKPAFGIPSASSDAGAKFAFGASSTDSTQKFGLGASALASSATQLGAEPAAQKRSFGALSSAPAGEGQPAKPSFGSVGNFGSSAPSFTAPSTDAKTASDPFNFGAQLPQASQSDQAGVPTKQPKVSFNFAAGTQNGSGAAIGGGLFGAANGGPPAPSPVVDLDARPKPQPPSFVFGSSASVGAQPAFVFGASNTARPQIPAATTEMSNNLLLQQQQQQLQFAGQGNGPADPSNPFNAQSSANRPVRSRISARRRLGPK